MAPPRVFCKSNADCAHFERILNQSRYCAEFQEDPDYRPCRLCAGADCMGDASCVAKCLTGKVFKMFQNVYNYYHYHCFYLCYQVVQEFYKFLLTAFPILGMITTIETAVGIERFAYFVVVLLFT